MTLTITSKPLDNPRGMAIYVENFFDAETGFSVKNQAFTKELIESEFTRIWRKNILSEIFGLVTFFVLWVYLLSEGVNACIPVFAVYTVAAYIRYKFMKTDKQARKFYRYVLYTVDTLPQMKILTDKTDGRTIKIESFKR